MLDDMLPCLCLGRWLLADVSVFHCLSSNTSVVKFLTRRVRVSILFVSLSLPFLTIVWDFLLVSLESFVGSSLLMTPIMHRSFSTSMVSSQFSSNVGFTTHLMNCTILVGNADV